MDWQSKLYLIPGLIVGFTVHEFGHALAAYILGDKSIRIQDRITLNPLKHIDPIGFLLIVFVGVGWAKPVAFDPERLKNFQRDRALIALAGPVSNLLLGILFAYVYQKIMPEGLFNYSRAYNSVGMSILRYAIVMNFILFVFNLIPIPPLDGSHVFFSILNLKAKTESFFRILGFLVLIILLVLQLFNKIDMFPIVTNLTLKIYNFFM